MPARIVILESTAKNLDLNTKFSIIPEKNRKTLQYGIILGKVNCIINVLVYAHLLLADPNKQLMAGQCRPALGHYQPTV